MNVRQQPIFAIVLILAITLIVKLLVETVPAHIAAFVQKVMNRYITKYAKVDINTIIYFLYCGKIYYSVETVCILSGCNVWAARRIHPFQYWCLLGCTHLFQCLDGLVQ